MSFHGVQRYRPQMDKGLSEGSAAGIHQHSLYQKMSDQSHDRNIRTALQARLPKPVLDNARLFHLRGGIDYSRLNFAHRTMMRLLYAAAKNQPPEQQNAETRAMIETYGKAVDFVDLAALGPIVQALAGQGDGEKPQV